MKPNPTVIKLNKEYLAQQRRKQERRDNIEIAFYGFMLWAIGAATLYLSLVIVSKTPL